MGPERFPFRLGALVVCCGLLFFAGRATADAPQVSGGLPELGLAPALSGLLGLPMVRIDVVFVGGRWARPVALRRVRTGVPFSSDVARLALTELLDSGRYADARVEVAREGNGVVLRLLVT